MKFTRNILTLVPAFVLAITVSFIGTDHAMAEDAPRVSRHTYRPANAGSVAQLAAASQNVAPSRVVKAQPLIGKANGNSATVNNLSTQSTRELSASGVAGVETQTTFNQVAPVAGVAQPLVVNPVTQTTHAQVVTNQYAGVGQPTVYTTYTNYGHPSSYTVQTGYAPSYTAATYVPTYTSSYRTFPVYTPSSYCSTPTYRYPVYTHYRSHYYHRPTIRVGHHYGHYSHGNHYSRHRGHYGHRSSGHIGYHGSRVSIGFSFGRGSSYCR